MEEFAALVDTLTEELRKGMKEFSAGGGVSGAIHGFINAIDWTEPWLLCLLSSYVLLLIIVVSTRRQVNLQTAIFLLSLAGIYFAERINGIASRNWRHFASQDYFDSHGVFMSTLFSGPLLVISIVVLVNMLITLTQLMVKWKRAELKHKARAARAKAE